MSSAILKQFIPSQMLTLLLGGWLVLISHTPVNAQFSENSSVLLTQQQTIENLPPLANLQPTQPAQVNRDQQDFQPSQPMQLSQYYNQNSERFSVYVDAHDSQTLRRVRQIEPGAYIRRFNGRAVIQSGVFNRQSGAQQRIRELESNNIYGARVVRYSDGNGQERVYSTGYSNNSYGDNYGQGNYRRENSNYYYVAIPAKSEELNSIASQIRQRVGQYDIVLERMEPRGPHVAVGPFTQRSDAEQWNKYLQELGFSNARVYYGK